MRTCKKVTYIVLDLEWNQAYPGKAVAECANGNKMYGEIIQIGAVKLSGRFEIDDEFKICIRPKFYKVLHHKIKELTGIGQKELARGKDFCTAIDEFKSWCGEDCVFLTWGPDDMRVLRQNLEMYKLDFSWAETWFNVQIIYNIQTDSGNNQKALSTAMEHFGIEAERPMHDALNDAYYTALVAGRLDMKAGIARLVADAANRAAKDDIGPCACEIYGGYKGRREAFDDKDVSRIKCPECGKICTDVRKWVFERRGQYMALASCKKHGRYLARLKFSKKQNGEYGVTKSLYVAGEGADAAYDKCAEKAEQRRYRRVTEKTRNIAKG